MQQEQGYMEQNTGKLVVFKLFGTRVHNGKRVREWRAQSDAPLASAVLRAQQARIRLGTTAIIPGDARCHPDTNRFALMDETETKAMADDIKANGQKEAIELLPDGRFICGRNRWNACLIAGVEPLIKQHPDGWNEDTLAYVISSNRHRKQHTPAQIAQTAYGLVETDHGGARKSSSAKSPHLKTFADAASSMSINIDQIRTYAAVDKLALDEIIDAIDDGRIKTVGHAYFIVTPDDDDKRDGVTSEDRQSKWLADPRNIKRKPRKLKPPRSTREITDRAIRELSGAKLLAIVKREMTKLNREAALEGKRLLFEDLSNERAVSSGDNPHLNQTSGDTPSRDSPHLNPSWGLQEGIRKQDRRG